MTNTGSHPDDIYDLCYSPKQRMFHFEEGPNLRKPGWVILKTVSVTDAMEFCDFMDKKYVIGRRTGVLPEISVVRLELDLFFELKKVRRKLSGRY